MRQRKGPDHPVKAERGIQHLKVQKRAKPALYGNVHALLRFVEQVAQHVDGHKGDKPGNRRIKEGRQCRCRHDRGKDQDDGQHDGQFQPLNRGELGHAAFDGGNPMHVFALVEEVFQRHHHQEGPAKGGNRQMRAANDAGVFLGLGCGEFNRLPRADFGGKDHDQEREDDPHAKDRNQDAPGQEPLLPDRSHFLQFVGVDDGIVEGQADFQDRQHSADEQEPHHPSPGVGVNPAEPCREGQSNGCHQKRPAEIVQSNRHRCVSRSLPRSKRS